jgi:hypothetical protein
MKLQTKIFIGLILILSSGLAIFYFSWKQERHERIRHESNESELTKNIDQVNMVLNLERKDFERMNTKWSNKIDSVIEANKIALKSVKSATIIQTQYKDTGSFKIVYREPEKQPDSSYIIPISTDNGCWGLKGQILTTDKDAKFKVTESTANNSAQLIVLRKRFLGFLWYKNKTSEYRAFSDCGEVEFNQVNFVKK